MRHAMIIDLYTYNIVTLLLLTKMAQEFVYTKLIKINTLYFTVTWTLYLFSFSNSFNMLTYSRVHRGIKSEIKRKSNLSLYLLGI